MFVVKWCSVLCLELGVRRSAPPDHCFYAENIPIPYEHKKIHLFLFLGLPRYKIKFYRIVVNTHPSPTSSFGCSASRRGQRSGAPLPPSPIGRGSSSSPSTSFRQGAVDRAAQGTTRLIRQSSQQPPVRLWLWERNRVKRDTVKINSELTGQCFPNKGAH